jgi:heptaprenyl diphosphate synthase
MNKNVLEFDAAFEMVKQETKRILHSGPSLISNYTGYLSDATGKMMRASALLAASMNEEGMVPYDAVIFASAVEILHLATLVHDDIMDDADTRRGLITLQKKAGKRTAVICGDYLLAAAINELSKVVTDEKYKKFNFSRYVESIALGELRQNINNRNFRLKTFRYLSIIDGKTAALFEAAYHAGALAGDADEQQIKLFRKLGRYTGIIFQLTDDCIDFENTKETALKPVMSDFQNGVVTLPLIHTFSKNPSLIEKAEKNQLSTEEMYQQVMKAGGVEFTHQLAKDYYEKATRTANSLSLNKMQQKILLGLLERAYVGLKK